MLQRPFEKLLILAALLVAHVACADSDSLFDFALLETTAIAQAELAKLPCQDQLIALQQKDHPDDHAEVLKAEFSALQVAAVNRVVALITAKYAGLAADQTAQIRSTAEYIILPAQIPDDCGGASVPTTAPQTDTSSRLQKL